MSPEDALPAARSAAAEAVRAGRYAEAGDVAVPPTEVVTRERLLRWALIEPDLAHVRSTRRYGRPITAAKRGLLRLLRQYLGQLLAEQTRFNLQVTAYVSRLEDRIARLEAERDATPQAGAPPR